VIFFCCSGDNSTVSFNIKGVTSKIPKDKGLKINALQHKIAWYSVVEVDHLESFNQDDITPKHIESL